MEYPVEKMTGKIIIFYSPKYNRAERWLFLEGDDAEETKDVIKAWEALGLITIGLMSYLEGERQFEPFDGHTVDEMKSMLPILGAAYGIPPGMEFKPKPLMTPIKQSKKRGV